MVTMASTLILAILCFILAQELEINDGNQYIMVAAQHIDCRGKCNYRCSKASREKICLRACNTCCQRCSCVPPGTVGNKNMCPCYATLNTHYGKLKCP
ncbi:PREDICTED: gibberellin-regulated protein 2-like [Lupinus angustifolius]|uniref:gibberellin-regulated protein 2-like n=1 Tax=Lupinus angustifolius TaxID=3871 RepID=UPI00092FC907|nr:PREDICTED: gibberellin-regulated protein 2-like [Lupinus angustifolius]